MTMLDQQIESALAAARSAQESASHEDNQPENQYDTLALEAAYLAHGQSERILQLQQQKIQLGRWQPVAVSQEVIGLGSVVTLESVVTGEQECFWLTPVSGRELTLEGQRILALFRETPLAMAMIGKEVGDCLVRGDSEWEICGID